MKAWERELQWIQAAKPPKTEKSQEKNWMKYAENGIASDEKLFRDWISAVPGSLAPCHLVVAAIQSMHNKGYDVSEAEKYIDAGLEAAQQKDGMRLQAITSKIYSLLNYAPKNVLSDYWKYSVYNSWEDIKKEVVFPVPVKIDVRSEIFAKKIYAGWQAQLIGGALGTQLEGYTTDNIREVFGEVKGYTRKPETYNDDITYELAFLEAFIKKGYNVSSEDIAVEWLRLIPDGYSAEETALFNLRRGIMPPESGRYYNYFSDWIGAQMRTAIHGMIAPGNPELAAKLAVYDGLISHSNNGILGGMFNAVLVSMSFAEKDTRILIKKALDTIPHNSQYYNIGIKILKTCENAGNWESAWKTMEEELKEYHWIHAYPNLAAEIVALWFGQKDFDETAHIIAMAGQDADCTAAPVLNVLAVMDGAPIIGKKWAEPLGENIHTFMRDFQNFTLKELADKTVKAIVNANLT